MNNHQSILQTIKNGLHSLSQKKHVPCGHLATVKEILLEGGVGIATIELQCPSLKQQHCGQCDKNKMGWFRTFGCKENDHARCYDCWKDQTYCPYCTVAFNDDKYSYPLVHGPAAAVVVVEEIQVNDPSIEEREPLNEFQEQERDRRERNRERKLRDRIDKDFVVQDEPQFDNDPSFHPDESDSDSDDNQKNNNNNRTRRRTIEEDGGDVDDDNDENDRPTQHHKVVDIYNEDHNVDDDGEEGEGEEEGKEGEEEEEDKHTYTTIVDVVESNDSDVVEAEKEKGEDEHHQQQQQQDVTENAPPRFTIIPSDNSKSNMIELEERHAVDVNNDDNGSIIDNTVQGEEEEEEEEERSEEEEEEKEEEEEEEEQDDDDDDEGKKKQEKREHQEKEKEESTLEEVKEMMASIPEQKRKFLEGEEEQQQEDLPDVADWNQGGTFAGICNRNITKNRFGQWFWTLVLTMPIAYHFYRGDKSHKDIEHQYGIKESARKYHFLYYWAVAIWPNLLFQNTCTPTKMRKTIIPFLIYHPDIVEQYADVLFDNTQQRIEIDGPIRGVINKSKFFPLKDQLKHIPEDYFHNLLKNHKV